jgi:hypothetical protein
MQKNVKTAVDPGLAAARRTLLALARRVPTVQAAADTRIHQSQVSRLFRGQFKRVSANVRTLLAYAAEPRRRPSADDPSRLAKGAVIRAALRTWDQTPQGARALVRLLKSVEVMRQAYPRKSRSRD